MPRQVHRYQDFPDYPNGVMMYPLMSLAREKGFRVLLTGSGGDHWLTGSFHHYADFLRQPQDTVFDPSGSLRPPIQLGLRSACDYLSTEPYFEVRALATRASDCASCD